MPAVCVLDHLHRASPYAHLGDLEAIVDRDLGLKTGAQRCQLAGRVRAIGRTTDAGRWPWVAEDKTTGIDWSEKRARRERKRQERSSATEDSTRA